ncbi:MAG: M48 metallopeptidase family protein [Marmoricola sp.]
MTQRPPVEVRRSRRRTRTVSAYRKDGTVIVLIPARFSKAEEAKWVDTMVARLDGQRRHRRSDPDLVERARRLGSELDLPTPVSVRWVTNQSSRWGSCTPGDGSIRLSHRLQGMPAWVVDYVLVHELAHLVEASHDAGFWRLVDRFPKSERAKGYLEGVAAGAHLEMEDDLPG